MTMGPRTRHALEEALALVPGVLGAVVLDEDNDAEVLEVQVFVQAGTDSDVLRRSLRTAASAATDRPVEVVALEVVGSGSATPRAADTPDRDAADAASVAVGAGGRPRLLSVVIDSSVTTRKHEAHVSLGGPGAASGSADIGQDSLLAVVAATCDALSATGQRRPIPRAVEPLRVADLDVAVVVVTIEGRPLVGTAIIEDEPEPAAVVRATLDAVNRWYGHDHGPDRRGSGGRHPGDA